MLTVAERIIYICWYTDTLFLPLKFISANKTFNYIIVTFRLRLSRKYLRPTEVRRIDLIVGKADIL